MENSPLREWVKRVPFLPFTVTLTSDRHVAVSGPEMIIIGRHWDIVAFVDDEGYDRIVIIYHTHVVSVDVYDPMQLSTPNGDSGS